MNQTPSPSSKMPEETSPNRLLTKMFLISSGLSILIALVLLVITAIGFGVFQYRKINHAMTQGGLPLSEAISQFKAGWNQEPIATNDRINILILGLDSLESRANDPMLTDSLIIASLNLNSGHVNLLSLPRDLWIDDYQTKINALYVYGEDRYPEKPENFTKEVVEEVTNIDIHHTFVMKMQDLSQIIDGVGGIEVNVPTSFVDEEFPNPETEISQESDPQKLYKTVSFNQGVERMTGQRVLEYVRSRHSADDSGTDVDRSHRQRIVIESLVRQLLKRDTLFDSTKITALTNIYVEKYQKQLPISEISAVAKKIWPFRTNITIESHELTVFPDVEQGVITHPPLYNRELYNGQWVYIIREEDLFKAYIGQVIGI